MDLLELDAVALSGAIRDGELKPVEVLEATVAAIEAQRGLNAVVADLFDRAAQRVTAGMTGPFAGVPLILKDACQELAGTPHWIGTAVLHRERHVSPATTATAARLEQLGFVIVGKGNVPELSVSPTTEPPEFGPTHNPYRSGITAGGSSGGSAAAVAARLAPIAHGSDGSGSLRIPASACGLLTLKPSRDRGPASLAAASDTDSTGTWAEFVLVRTARDLAAAWRVLAIDPAPIPSELRRLRVGLLRHDPLLGLDVHPACIDAVDVTGRVLADQGHVVDEAYPPALDGFVAEIFSDGVPKTGRVQQAEWIERRIGRPLRSGDLSPEMMAEIEAARSERAPTVNPQTQARVAKRLHDVQAWWVRYDLLVTPTLRKPPWSHGQPAAANAGGFPLPFSINGQPVLAAPVHVHDGLPVGVQIVANHGRDEDLLTLAAELEGAIGWQTRKPIPQ